MNRMKELDHKCCRRDMSLRVRKDYSSQLVEVQFAESGTLLSNVLSGLKGGERVYLPPYPDVILLPAQSSE